MAFGRHYQYKNINFNRQHKFNGCKYKSTLAFDFYLPDYNCCIEYDGAQHFIAVAYWGGEKGLIIQQLKDEIKTQYCKIENIDLLRISYKENIISKLNDLFYNIQPIH